MRLNFLLLLALAVIGLISLSAPSKENGLARLSPPSKENGLPRFSAPLRASGQEPTEPSYETIDSGKCSVQVCTDIEFGNYIFRLYAEDRGSTWSNKNLHVIPKDACTCQTIERRKRRVAEGLGLRIVTRDPAQSYWAAIRSDTRLYQNPARTAASDKSFALGTSFENLQRGLKGEPSPGFQRTDEFFSFWQPRLKNFDIYRTKEPNFMNGLHSYYLAPKEQTLKIRDQQQNVAFIVWNFPRTEEGYSLDEVIRKNFRPAGSVRLYPDMVLRRTFAPLTTPPDGWIAEFEKTIALIEGRLRPKSQP